MPEEVLLKSEQRLSRGEIAAYLREVANKLEAEGHLTLTAGEQRFDAELPQRLTFEVKAERETSEGGADPELSIEFEIEWPESGAEQDQTLQIG